MADLRHDESVWMTGGSSYLTESRLLKAGPFALNYENGAIRYVRSGPDEVLRMVYSAVRDQNWDTVKPRIVSENIREDKDGFVIDVSVAYEDGEVAFSADYRFTGDSTGCLRFSMKGIALSDFKKNRVGFCVLHPIKECSGCECIVAHVDGSFSNGIFPVSISPHQPFRNIGKFTWTIPSGKKFALTFTGDVFEMEDQRNWTDASFKTYCTPLSEPFPVILKKGTVVEQEIELIPIAALSGRDEKGSGSALRFAFDPASSRKMPNIGTGRPSAHAEYSSNDEALIRSVGFGHYRCDVKFSQPDWHAKLIKALDEASSLDLPMILALHFNDESSADAVHRIGAVVEERKARLHAVVLFHGGSKTTPGWLIDRYAPLCEELFPGVKTGAGTDAYFAELNRTPPPTDKIDFLTFSLNPQVHAFDNASLVESLEAQRAVVESALLLANGKPVHVAPITLKPRFNPNATAHDKPDATDDVDSRQLSLFAAGWTVGSIKHLAEAGAECITYFEAMGRKGLFMSDMADAADNPGSVSPVFEVFRTVSGFKPIRLLKSTSSDPLVFDGLVVENESSRIIIIANFQHREITLTVEGAAPATSALCMLDIGWMANRGWRQPPLYRTDLPGDDDSVYGLKLGPFAIAIIRSGISSS